jgi:hypothetical protein
MNIKIIINIILINCLLISFAHAELKDENLLQSMPDGYKVGQMDKKEKVTFVEMVPKAQSVQTWTEMLTTTVYHGGIKLNLNQYYSAMSAMWKKSCKGSSGVFQSQGKENGYPFALWVLICPLNPASQKPEWTWFKAIEGNDSFYVIQKSWRMEPKQDDVVSWMKYLRKIEVCDTRLPERKCPVVKK